MTSIADRQRTDPTTVDTFDSLDPATGEVVATFPVQQRQEIDKAVELAREASRWWAGVGFKGRRKRLAAWRTLIAGRMDEFAALIHREGGKPLDDALLEITLAVDHIDWSSKHAAKVLGRRQVAPGLLLANHTASVGYVPYGVIGVIGPWNYPVFTPLGSIAYALAAGNAVVFKPSEFTPAIGAWLVKTFAEVVPEQPVLQLVTGLGSTGAALCESGVDKVAFTGSTGTGKKVMAACAQTLTPVLVECGGKDVLILDRDGDVQAAAQAAVWGGMANAGQTCIGVERVYAHADVYDDMVAAMSRIAATLTPGPAGDSSYGPMTMPSQLGVIKRHIDDALARGGRAVVGGADSVRAPYVDPVILTDVPEESSAVQEETFGPVIVVKRVRDADEAIELANGTPYGLAASVFAKKRADEIVSRLRVGMATINSVISFAGIPALPFGGVGDSGFGRIHGDDGLREFARAQSIARMRVPIPLVLTSFARRKGDVRLVAKATQKRFRA